MATKNLLSNDERLELIEKYKKEKLNAPPSNIKDETLITNFGTDEQKARLSQPQTDAKQKGTENEAATEAGAASETGAEQGAADTGVDPVTQGVQEHNSAMFRYRELYGVDPDYNLTTGEINALSDKKQEEISASKTEQQTQNATQAPAVDQNQEYIKEFGRYVDLFLKMPIGNPTLEELRKANDEKEKQNEQDKIDAAQIKQNALAMQNSEADSSVTLVNKKDPTNQIVVSQYTWDKFLSKDTEWQLMPKPPVETIGH